MPELNQIIAITTYNRKVALLSCLNCLAEATGLAKWKVILSDDCSTDYDIHEIAATLPFDCTVLRSTQQLGASGNSVSLLKTCLERGADRIFMLDSDMIVSKDVLAFIEQHFPQTGGVLSVYNSVLHTESSALNDELVLKSSVGGAATIWDSHLLSELLSQFDSDAEWDWQLCKLLASHQIQFSVARNSRAQHLGIGGTNNNRFGSIDYGLGFKIDTHTQALALANAHQSLMSSQSQYMKPPKPPKRKGIKRLIHSLKKRLKSR